MAAAQVSGQWAVYVTRCRACKRPGVDVAPATTPLPFECSHCGEWAVWVDPRRARRVERWLRGGATESPQLQVYDLGADQAQLPVAQEEV